MHKALVAVLTTYALFASAQLRKQAEAAHPQTGGTVTVSGLRRPVTVIRDHWGVAHIYAENQHDLFFAQGYVAAQDRLFQMELWKRVGQGRLAEILGSSFLERDVAARLLRYRGDLQGEYLAYGADTRDILAAFTSGINAYIQERRNSSEGLPLEFQLAGFDPELWNPEDCLMRMAGYPMTGNALSELYHAQLVSSLGVERAGRLLDLPPGVKLDPVSGADYSDIGRDVLRNFVGSDTRIEFPGQTPAVSTSTPASPGLQDAGDDWLSASNNWTVSGRLTASGKPILANDPHRTIAVPSLRYMIHLVAPPENGSRGWDVIGAGEPGLPGVAVGHNQDIAWGFTIFPEDQQDLYLEQMNPEHPDEYQTESGWKRVQAVAETFQVKNQPPVQRELKFTRHGPIVWADGHRALALRWTGAEPGTAGYLGSLAVDRAHNWQEFEAAMEKWRLPAENIVYADRAGNIGEHSAGLAPIRKNWTGLLPVDGASGKYEWAGFVPLGELPHWHNPAQGFVATANNNVTPPGYPYKIGFEWGAPYRVDRIRQLLSPNSAGGAKPEKLTVKDMERIQTDTTSLAAKQLIEILRNVSAHEPSQTPLAAVLLNWDGNLTRGSAAAVLYEYWVNSMRRALAPLLLGGASPQQSSENARLISLVEPRLPLPVLIANLREPQSDVFGKDAVAKRNELVLAALASAEISLKQRQGDDPQGWAWGKLHTIHFRHSLDSVTADAAQRFDIGPFPRPGDGTTVNATGGFPGQTAGASYREIFDLADWDKAVAVNTPGQSGDPASPHYRDLEPLWDQGQYFPLSYSRQAVERNAGEKLVLKPR
ncbi:MAG: penicillin acylase family protein [Acidobacteria bacterium]|nr:penicillin acylase family protein [Acidobacteriota bacterium]